MARACQLLFVVSLVVLLVFLEFQSLWLWGWQLVLLVRQLFLNIHEHPLFEQHRKLLFEQLLVLGVFGLRKHVLQSLR